MSGFFPNGLKQKKIGFTLIELMIVVAIVGILATTAIPSFLEYTKKAKFAEAFVIMNSIQKAQIVNFVQDGFMVPDMDWGISGSSNGVSTGGQKFPIKNHKKALINSAGNENAAIMLQYHRPLFDVLPDGTPSYFSYRVTSESFASDGSAQIMGFQDGEVIMRPSISNGVYIRYQILNPLKGSILSMDYESFGIPQNPGEHYSLVSAGIHSGGGITMPVSVTRFHGNQISSSPLMVVNLPFTEGAGNDDGKGDGKDDGGGDGGDDRGGDDRGGDDRGGDDRGGDDR